MNIADSLYKLWQSTGIANFIQPADPSADYLLRSAMYNVATPFPSSAYVYDPETDTGHVIYMAANTEIVRFDITRDLI